MPRFNETPLFDRADDPNNEDFIEANRKKFKTAEDVVDEDSEFTDDSDSEREKLKNNKKAAEQSALEKVRHDIRDYTYKGPDNVALASFHIDHDKEEMIGVTEEGLESFRPTDPETIENAPLEEDLAEVNIAHDRKMSVGTTPFEPGGYDKSSGHDNLKTIPDNKLQRNNRGLIRKFLDTFSKN